MIAQETEGPPLTASAVSHRGQVRDVNEDAVGLFIEHGLFIVADGMGGRSKGDVASELAVEELERFFCSKLEKPNAPWPFPIDKNVSMGANLLRVGIKVANSHIRRVADSFDAHPRMGATVAALAVGETQFSAANVGDVRGDRVRAGTLERISRDHSIAEEMRRTNPQMSEEALEQMANRHIVTRTLGTDNDVEPALYQGPLEEGDVFLLCCDGLWDELGDLAMATILGATSDLEEAAQALVDAANAAGGKDNVTALLVKVG